MPRADILKSDFLYAQEVTVDDAHIKAINNMAARLERQNREEVKTVKQRRQQLNERYLLHRVSER